MKKLLYLSLIAFLLTSGSSMTFAAGGGGGSSSGGGSSGGSSGGGGTSGGATGGDSSGGGGNSAAQEVKKCKKGEVAKKVKQSGILVRKCFPVASGILPDGDLYEQGRMLAKTGEYEWALQVLAAIENQNDPRVLNYTGYSNRKAGRLEIGITYYRKALAIDPNFVLAREYLGEGYVAAGRIDLARLELNEIKNRAGTSSEEYQDLSKAIATGVIEPD
jgi:tetratricopeptide (TPR) repeat protein